MSLIIGLGYKARQGKDTVVSHILKTFGQRYDIRRMAFADELKKEVNQAAEQVGGMFNLFQALAEGKIDKAPALPDWVKFDPNPDMTDPMCPLGKQRTLLQWWGTEFRRNSDRNYWVKKLDDAVKLADPTVVLVPDMRFKNEYFWVQARKGYTIKVERQNFSDPNVNPNHISERDLDGVPFNYTITVLDGDMQSLYRLAEETFNHIVKLETPVVDTDFTVAPDDYYTNDLPTAA